MTIGTKKERAWDTESLHSDNRNDTQYEFWACSTSIKKHLDAFYKNFYLSHK